MIAPSAARMNLVVGEPPAYREHGGFPTGFEDLAAARHAHRIRLSQSTNGKDTEHREDRHELLEAR